jgi:hypothetical protein
MATQEVLNEYEALMEELVTSYQYGTAFVRCILLAITMYSDAASRNEYITTMSKTFRIPTDKVERVIALLPA